MPWDDDLTADDDLTRWLAVRQAADHGGPQHIDVLLDLALHDPTEVQTVGGMAEHWEHLGDVAASSLADVLARQDGLDERIRRAATDLAEDDGRVGAVLCRLDARYEPVRA